jgi:hypothetical protein
VDLVGRTAGCTGGAGLPHRYSTTRGTDYLREPYSSWMHGGAGLRRGRRTPVVELPAGAVRAVVVAAVRAGLACGPKPSPLEHHARRTVPPPPPPGVFFFFFFCL